MSIAWTPNRETLKAPPRPVFTFTCCACEAVHSMPEPTLPPGWVVEQVDNETFLFCPECAADVPQETVQ